MCTLNTNMTELRENERREMLFRTEWSGKAPEEVASERYLNKL